MNSLENQKMYFENYINNHKEVSQAEANYNELISNSGNENNKQFTESEIENTVTNKVMTLPEKNRMQIYFGKFISYIEEKDYENAYKLLNENFKNNYFDTIEKFEEYMKKYPSSMAVEYLNFERQGELFVLTVNIKDVFNSSASVINQRVVIRENEANDFTISFQVE